MKSRVKINGDEFESGRIPHCLTRPIARFQRAAQTIAMASIDRDRALRAQMSMRDFLENFLFQTKTVGQ